METLLGDQIRNLKRPDAQHSRRRLCPCPRAMEIAAAVRAHRAIKNALHWVLDLAFDADRARNGKDNGPEKLTIL